MIEIPDLFVTPLSKRNVGIEKLRIWDLETK